MMISDQIKMLIIQIGYYEKENIQAKTGECKAFKNVFI